MSGPGSKAIARAPATVANVAVGFDIMGFELPVCFDQVEATRNEPGDLEIGIDALEGQSADALPREPDRNTAAIAVAQLIQACDLGYGFRLRLRKGIPLASGMGGSAASSVAAVFAANALLDAPLRPEELLPLAVAGEAAVTGAAHADNAAASLLGGLVVVLPPESQEVLKIPVPTGVVCSLVHPHLMLETRAAREALGAALPLVRHTEQSAQLAGFIAGCYRDDLDLIGRCLRDVVVEPQRAPLIPAFDEVQRAGMEAGALGLSISGGGPSLFAWSANAEIGGRVTDAMRATFQRNGIECDAWLSPIAETGAHLVDSWDGV